MFLCPFSPYLTGALPNPKSKANKTGAVLRHKDTHLSSELTADSSFDEQGIVPKHMNKDGRSRKSEPIPSNPRDDDDDDGDDGIENDSDREESKRFFHLAKFEKKKKERATREAAEYKEKFLATVKCDEEALRKRSIDFELATSSKNQEFLKALKHSFTLTAPIKSSKNEDACNFPSMKMKCHGIIALAQRVASKFEEVVGKSAVHDIPTMFENDWVAQDEHTKHLLEIGKDVGRNKFESIMKASKPAIMNDDTIAVSETLFPPPDNADIIGWGKQARRQMKANKKLLKKC
ncbi:hypothetical protein CJF31_00010809 [Rutstroemia sp. NJR-2017a BVV2]|nr:hypothetical protein CJF31_00010809 [Rutstroemia sp. NJR-2017a BVV2]